MRKIITLSAGLVALLLSASNGYADSFTVNFCPADDSCPANVSEARMTFDEILVGGDLNDYLLTIKIVGTAGTPQYIDSVQFTITGVDTPSGYEAKPSLQMAPLQGAAWAVYWDTIAGNPADCSSDTLQGQGVCAQSTGNGASTDGTNIWQFLVDLDDEQAALGVGTAVDLRVHFRKDGPHGILPGGNLSPESGGVLETGSDETSTDETSTDETSTDETSTDETSTVPEPAVLSLLGLALAAGAHRLKRNSAQQ